MSAEYSARESGSRAARGTATAEELPILSDPEQELVLPELVSRIEDVGRRQFLLDRRFLPGVSDVTLMAELIHLPEHGKTRQESGHTVLFGQLLLEGDDEGEHSLYVAVKPFGRAEDAAKEYAVSGYFASGNVPACTTFRPLGVMRTPGGSPAIISHYRHSVRSMDGIFWNPDLVHEAHIVEKALGRAGVGLARKHDAGWVHGDFEAKNAAWDVTKPHDISFMIDLEDSRYVGHLSPEVQDAERMKDIEVFIGTLFRLKEDNYVLPGNYEDQIKAHFGLTYVGARSTLGTPDNSIALLEKINGLVDEGNPA